MAYNANDLSVLTKMAMQLPPNWVHIGANLEHLVDHWLADRYSKRPLEEIRMFTDRASVNELCRYIRGSIKLEDVSLTPEQRRELIDQMKNGQGNDKKPTIPEGLIAEVESMTLSDTMRSRSHQTSEAVTTQTKDGRSTNYETSSGDFRKFETGAVRSPDNVDVPMSYIPPEALRAFARRFAIGLQKYPEHNWLKGFPIMILLDHAIAHIEKYIAGDTSDEHLAGAIWNIGVAIHQNKYRPDLDNRPPYAEFDKRTDEQKKLNP